MNESKIWERDLPIILRKIYKKCGGNFPKIPIHSLIDLIEWLLRIPDQSPRSVYKSDQLQKRILTLYEMRGLSEIEKRILTGGDLKPYLGDMTKSIRNHASKRNDYFSSDWGLLHFHLGADFENKGIKVSRTGRILIARFENGSSYFIDIVNHGKGHPDVWGNASHLEILYRNWPILLGKAMRENVEKTIKPSASDYKKLRSAGINVPIVIDGKLFEPLGRGITQCGNQIEAVEISQQIHKELEKAESEFRKIEPSANALLALKQEFSIDSTLFKREEFSIGFFTPKKNNYHCIYNHSDNNQVIGFFSRLLKEIPLPITCKSSGNYILPNS